MTLKNINSVFSYVDFKNNFSETYGGSIFFSFTYTSKLYNMLFHNSTSSSYGNAFYVLANESYDTNIHGIQIIQTGICNENNKFTTEGTFFGSYGSSFILIEKYDGKNLCTGPFIISEGDAESILNQSNIENVHSKNDGPLIKVTNPHKKGSNFTFNECTFRNITQVNDAYSPMIATVNNGFVKIIS